MTLKTRIQGPILAIDRTSYMIYKQTWKGVRDKGANYNMTFKTWFKIPLFVSLVMLIGLCACRKKEDGAATAGGTLPGGGATTTMTYTGPINQMDTSLCFRNCRQSVTTNADVIDYPADNVAVYLCRNSDCVNGPVPSIQCSSLAGGSPVACYTGMPNPGIVLEKNAVAFVNEFEKSYSDAAHTIVLDNGFSSYVITTVISR
jgi:hypothetical protein